MIARSGPYLSQTSCALSTSRYVLFQPNSRNWRVSCPSCLRSDEPPFSIPIPPSLVYHAPNATASTLRSTSLPSIPDMYFHLPPFFPRSPCATHCPCFIYIHEHTSLPIHVPQLATHFSIHPTRQVSMPPYRYSRDPSVHGFSNIQTNGRVSKYLYNTTST